MRSFDMCLMLLQIFPTMNLSFCIAEPSVIRKYNKLRTSRIQVDQQIYPSYDAVK